MTEGVTGRRCSMCGETFSFKAEWVKCPICGEETSGFQNADITMNDAEATKALRLREFQEYLEKEGKT